MESNNNKPQKFGLGQLISYRSIPNNKLIVYVSLALRLRVYVECRLIFQIDLSVRFGTKKEGYWLEEKEIGYVKDMKR